MLVSTSIKVGRQAVELVTNDNRVIIELDALKKKLTLFEKEQDPRTKRFRDVPKNHFYLYEEHDNFFKIIVSINSLRHVIDLVKRARVDHKVTIDSIHYKPSKSLLTLKPDFIPREEQEKFIQALVKDDGIPAFLLDLQPGYGKAEWVENKIRIPNGWKRMGDVVVGDEVIAKDGTITEVTGVYPQGLKEMYEITFSDGRKNICCGEHLWKVYNRYFKDGYKIVNTEEIIKLINRSKEASKRFYIDLLDPEQNEKKEFFIHPYVLGTFLGDGCFTQKSLTLYLSDLGVANRIRHYLNTKYELDKRKSDNITYTLKNRYQKYNNVYKSELDRYGLLGKYSHEKFIPRDYLNGSTEQRMELLKGLLDTDGNVLKLGSIQFSTSSKQLCLDFVELVRSLGGTAKVKEKLPYYILRGEKVQGRLSYLITIRMKNPKSCLTRIYKRQERLKENNQYSNNLKLRIDKVVKLKDKLEAQCISIEHPDKLYVTQDYVVTHNTLIGYHSMVRMKQKFCVLVKPTFLDKWVDDVRKYSDITEEQIYVIRGRDSLLKLFDMKREEVKKIDVFVISMRTITNYHYLCFTENYYKVRPENFMEYTGITNVLNDESHKEFEALFKVIMWMNPYKLLGLSATMDSNKPGENDFYNLLYPKKDRLNSMFGLNRYLTLMFVNYKLARGINLPHKTFKGYNHIMYEQAIMRNINVLTDYIEMILEMVAKHYIDYQEEQKYDFKNPKCLLFFSTVDMCMIMTKKIKEVYKHLKVQKYTAEDKYEDMIQSDIIISTNMSLSTGIDIPNLITAIQTVSIGDQQLNIQAAGRLREIKGKDVLYICLQTDSIQKQQQLKLKRLNTLRDRVRHIRYDSYNKYIGIKGANDVGIDNNKKVYKTPFFGKKTFYKSPFGKSGTKQKTWDRNKGRYRTAA